MPAFSGLLMTFSTATLGLWLDSPLGKVALLLNGGLLIKLSGRLIAGRLCPCPELEAAAGSPSRNSAEPIEASLALETELDRFGERHRAPLVERCPEATVAELRFHRVERTIADEVVEA